MPNIKLDYRCKCQYKSIFKVHHGSKDSYIQRDHSISHMLLFHNNCYYYVYDSDHLLQQEPISTAACISVLNYGLLVMHKSRSFNVWGFSIYIIFDNILNVFTCEHFLQQGFVYIRWLEALLGNGFTNILCSSGDSLVGVAHANNMYDIWKS